MPQPLTLAASNTSIATHPESVHSIRARNLDQLNLHANILLKSIISSDKARERRVQFLNRIQKLINTHLPGKQITAHLFGSSVTGLDFGGSDCDVALETEKNDDKVNVKLLAKILRQAGMRHVVPISGARVPIVKFYDPVYSISCDINVNNTLGVHNSQMIKDYLSIDDRVKKLIMLIKHWAKRRGINSSSGGSYSSYCYVLMAIFFLQNIDEPILPSLQQISLDLKEEQLLIPTQFKKRTGNGGKKKQAEPPMNYADITYFKELNILTLYFKKPSDLTMPSVVELFVQFCVFYLGIIKTPDSMVSIRTGKVMPVKEIWRNRDYLLYVEDPFDLERNVACTASKFGEKSLVSEMKRVVGLFQAGNCTVETLFEKKSDYSFDVDAGRILQSIGLANNQQAKPKKPRNQRGKTNQLTEASSLPVADTVVTHALDIKEKIAVEHQGPDIIVQKDTIGRSVQVLEDSSQVDIQISHTKTKTKRKQKESLHPDNEPIQHTIGIIELVETDKQKLPLKSKRAQKSASNGDLKDTTKKDSSSARTSYRGKTKSQPSKATIKELSSGLGALQIKQNPTRTQKPPKTSREPRSNGMVKNRTAHVSNQTSEAKKRPTNNDRSSGPITPPTSDDDRNSIRRSKASQGSKPSSVSSRSRNQKKGVKKSPDAQPIISSTE
ncbi:hypothetical protein K493DRAFT_59097 [Basidiobolus meristosporus CBS 931.73]|uniref:Poly(A) RNA polymerase mitochondrial-like central palm domain-containing protein n=1 Tax=Basidiobolus meristosporus CBS 931.73 TaxID=1314790 RepID=A0A1Y1Z1I9_9FUNG|nr:hypothetical protein K493DRAFT_59097 [Basidiobolus meristosporus CBS 931.73]|eukprot:ORY04163.1 hypothetical protein K493DRAFT_59097 [Basidiobolus meristosporus CBS 931.73]